MTLIIGVKCTDGVVMGADGAATLGSLGNRTVLQPSKKLSTHYNKIIVGVSGPVGLGQRISGEMSNIWDNNLLSGKKPFEAMTIISNELRKHIIAELNIASMAKNAVGNIALNSSLCSTLIALPLKHTPLLFQFDQQGAPEETTEDLPFSSIGSGQPIADPFLGFIRRVFWSNGCPKVIDAVFATVWTLKHAIQINPGGVAAPIQIISLVKINQSDYEIKEYSDGELQEHYEAIKAVENNLQEFRKSMQSTTSAVSLPKVTKVQT